MKMLFDVICGLATLASLALYFYEKHKRIVGNSLLTGFLHGIKATASGMASAGDEWRAGADQKPAGYVTGYANDCVNEWLRLHEQINDMLARIDKPAAQVETTCRCARLWSRLFGKPSRT